MKQVHAAYSFVASTKTITLTGLNIDQDQLLLIVNATRGVQYFNFADSSLRATVTAGANTTVVLTDASTTGHANGDALVIYYDDQVTTQAVSGTVTANPGTNPFTVTGSVALDPSSLIALENVTVTANVFGFEDQSGLYQPIPVGLATDGFGPNQYAVKALIGTEAGGLSSANPLPISGTVTVDNSVTIGSLPAISGTVTASITNLPSGALTTRFGSVTTANLSQLTSCVTNTSRKYLLAQNISTGTVTIGIGFSPTTTQGIQLAAGAGLTFDAFCPTGAVYWLGATTGATWTILEG